MAQAEHACSKALHQQHTDSCYLHSKAGEESGISCCYKIPLNIKWQARSCHTSNGGLSSPVCSSTAAILADFSFLLSISSCLPSFPYPCCHFPLSLTSLCISTMFLLFPIASTFSCVIASAFSCVLWLLLGGIKPKAQGWVVGSSICAGQCDVLWVSTGEVLQEREC